MAASRIAVVTLVSAPVLATSACSGVTELSVGQLASSDGATPTFSIDQLESKCAAPPGQVDTFGSAAELTARLSGRWYHCTSSNVETNWALPRGTGMVYDFTLAGAWAFLDYTDAQQNFTASKDADRSGQLLFYVVTGIPTDSSTGDNDAGPFDGMFIPFNETTTRHGIFLRQQRGDLEDYQFEPSFDRNPRRLHLNELNGTPVSADFVPIDD